LWNNHRADREQLIALILQRKEFWKKIIAIAVGESYIFAERLKEEKVGKEYIQDRYGNTIYITDERWEHIYEEHPDMLGYDQHVLETLRHGKREQDGLNPSKYFYTKGFHDLVDLNNHIIVVVKFGWMTTADGQEITNNFVLTAYQNFF
jgi:hypothetical protein